MDIEKGLFEALATSLLKTGTDQWGNVIQSPLAIAMSQWVETNKEKIQTIILDKINTEEFTNIIAEKITKDLSWLSSDWNKNYNKEKLEDKIRDKVAERLAKEVKI